MTASEILVEGYGRISDIVRGALADLGDEQLAHRPSENSNSIAWLVWHIARVIDSQIASASNINEIWASGWSKKFDLPFGESATGYGQTSEEVASVKVSSELLLGYFDAVNASTLAYLKTLNDKDLDEIIDKNWDPPVTRGVRLVSILGDIDQHAGQAAYLHGLILDRAG